KEWGGVFVSHDGGREWMQKSAGLGGRDVFALKQASNGALIAGTNQGVFELDRNASEWRPINMGINEKSAVRSTKKGSKKTAVAKTEVRSVLNARVNDLEVTPKRWWAATSAGLFSTSDQGKTWSGGPVMGKQDFVAVQANGDLLVAATHTNVVVSHDNGASWRRGSLSSYVTKGCGVVSTGEGQALG